ncbi:MAG TPA: hypothetical protein DET40_12350 [Lentisphaeria bacterium]|nr:MAG: hypothetical protein A2X45_00335 [Lentisphaerae bacterium GWF2_50_93]HCE44330.1 hypothetical protein [Lentisphaeria bacterium]
MTVDLNYLIRIEDDRTYEEDNLTMADCIRLRKPHAVISGDFNIDIRPRNPETPILFISYTSNA